MTPPSNITGVVPIADMTGDTDEETKRLYADYLRACDYVRTQKWCVALGDAYFGVGLGGVFSIFLIEIDPQPTGVDPWLWVIVGDIPPAYLVLDECPNPSAAAETYISLMRKWIDLAHEGKSSNKVFPLNMPPIPASAETLARKINSLQDNILPWLQQGPTIQ